MHHMCSPKEIHFMPPAMRPIEDKVKQQQASKPGPNIGLKVRDGNIFIDQRIDSQHHGFKEQPRYLVAHTDIQVSNSIIEAVKLLLAFARYVELNPDQQKEKGEYKEKADVFHLSIANVFWKIRHKMTNVNSMM